MEAPSPPRIRIHHSSQHNWETQEEREGPGCPRGQSPGHIRVRSLPACLQHGRLHLCVHLCVSIPTCVYVPSHMPACLNLCLHVYLCICISTCDSACPSACVPTCVSVCPPEYLCPHLYIACPLACLYAYLCVPICIPKAWLRVIPLCSARSNPNPQTLVGVDPKSKNQNNPKTAQTSHTNNPSTCIMTAGFFLGRGVKVETKGSYRYK